jgi:hypothetical protein
MTADDLRARFESLSRAQLVDALMGVACCLYEPNEGQHLDPDCEWDADTPVKVLSWLLPILPRELTGAGDPDVYWGALPETVRFVAQDADGEWYGFQRRPSKNGGGDCWILGDPVPLNPEQAPYYEGPWDQSLMERPS